MTHFHGVRFYDSSESIAAVVAAFLGAGFVTNEPALVIASPMHREAIASALRAISFSVESLERSGNLHRVDAHDTLNAFLVHGSPDPVRFDIVAGAMVERLRRHAGRAIRIYDEMTDLLWRQGKHESALRMEALWDRVTRDYECSLLCGHTVENFCSCAAPRSLCRQHSHLVAADGQPHRVTDSLTH